jgi:hypothetical protein
MSTQESEANLLRQDGHTSFLIELPQNLTNDLAHALQGLQIILGFVILPRKILELFPFFANLGIDLFVFQ